MALQTVDIKCYWVCSTGEEILQATPDDDLKAAIKLMNHQNEIDDHELWSITAEINT